MFRTPILAIAQNTFRETIRDRILYGLLGFALLYIFFDLFLARLALGDLLMIRSFGLAGIYVFSLIITIFLGASIIYKEIERRTLYFVLSKPVSRSEVIVGKFFGLFVAVGATTLLMTAVYLGVVAYEHGGFDTLGLVAVGFQLLEMALITALLIFFSSFSAPLSATTSAIIILFTGHLLETMLANARHIGGATLAAVRALYYVLPNLEKFNVRNLVVHGVSIPWEEALAVIGYALIYTVLLLYAAVLIFKKREL